MISSKFSKVELIPEIVSKLNALQAVYHSLVDNTCLSDYKKLAFHNDFDATFEKLILIYNNYQITKISLIASHLSVLGSYFKRIFIGLLFSHQITSEDELTNQVQNPQIFEWIKIRNQVISIFAFYQIDIDLTMPEFDNN